MCDVPSQVSDSFSNIGETLQNPGSAKPSDVFTAVGDPLGGSVTHFVDTSPVLAPINLGIADYYSGGMASPIISAGIAKENELSGTAQPNPTAMMAAGLVGSGLSSYGGSAASGASGASDMTSSGFGGQIGLGGASDTATLSDMLTSSAFSGAGTAGAGDFASGLSGFSPAADSQLANAGLTGADIASGASAAATPAAATAASEISSTGLSGFSPAADSQLANQQLGITGADASGATTGAPGAVTAPSYTTANNAATGAAGAAPAAAAKSSPSWMNSALGAVKSALPYAGLANSLLASKKGPNPVGQLNTNAAKTSEISNKLLSDYQAGQLSGADQQSIVQYRQDQKAAVDQYYAKAGLSNSSMHTAALQQVETQAETMRQQSLKNMLSGGLSAAGTSNSALTSAASAGLSESKDTSAAIQEFMTMLAQMNATPAAK
jgi:hypothetical protein